MVDPLSLFIGFVVGVLFAALKLTASRESATPDREESAT